MKEPMDTQNFLIWETMFCCNLAPARFNIPEMIKMNARSVRQLENMKGLMSSERLTDFNSRTNVQINADVNLVFLSSSGWLY